MFFRGREIRVASNIDLKGQYTSAVVIRDSELENLRKLECL
jgi:hypothetical protein